MPLDERTWLRPVFALGELHQLQPAQARMPVLADDNVVMHRDPERSGDVHDLPRHLDIDRGRCRIAGGMIVHRTTLRTIQMRSLTILFQAITVGGVDWERFEMTKRDHHGEACSVLGSKSGALPVIESFRQDVCFAPYSGYQNSLAASPRSAAKRTPAPQPKRPLIVDRFAPDGSRNPRHGKAREAGTASAVRRVIAHDMD